MRAARATFAAVILLAAGAVSAQNYPVKPLKLIIPYPAGGPTDILGRLIGQRLTEAWGQTLLIDNRPGGGGVIGGQLAAKSAPDGYTLYLSGITTLVLAGFTHRNLPYDAQRDFQPVTMATLQPLLLMVHPSLPAKNVRDYLALARAHPDAINYGSSGPGGSGHLAGVLLQRMTGIRIVHVPYRGAPPALNDLIAGQVQSMLGSALAAVPQIHSGKIRALAVTGATRMAALPAVPTFAEGGLPGYDASTWNGILVPAGTPPAIVERLNSEIVRILRLPATVERLGQDGSVTMAGSPEAFAAFIKAEMAKWGPVVRDAHLTIE